jgi:hypothetical protein
LLLFESLSSIIKVPEAIIFPDWFSKTTTILYRS